MDPQYIEAQTLEAVRLEARRPVSPKMVSGCSYGPNASVVSRHSPSDKFYEIAPTLILSNCFSFLSYFLNFRVKFTSNQIAVFLKGKPILCRKILLIWSSQLINV